MEFDWAAEVDKYAKKVAFQKTAIEPAPGAPALPKDAKLWLANYAQLLALPIAVADANSLTQAAELGQEWLDASCIAQERLDGRVVDAYLVIVCSETVPEDLFSVVRQIEIDPTSCRKHIAWPIKGDDDEIAWRRLLRITALGLPESPSATGMTNTPTLTSELQKILLTDIKNLKGKPAARQHVAQPISEVEQ